jgi:hypothetical protein
VWLLLGLCYWLDQVHPVVTTPHVEAFWGALFAAIAQAFVWIADKAVDIAVIIYHATLIVGRGIWEFSKQVGSWFVRGFDFLKKFWSGVLRPFIEYVRGVWWHIRAAMQTIFGPVLDFLWKVRTKLLELYTRYVRPVLDVIDRTRQILQILAQLRVPFARELDRKLAELEDRLVGAIRRAMLEINRLIAQVDRILDFNGLLQRLTLLRSLVRDQRYVTNLWWNAQTRPLTGSERAGLLADPRLVDAETVVGELGPTIDGRITIHTEGIARMTRIVDAELRGAR